jgi:hypothetical protein
LQKYSLLTFGKVSCVTVILTARVLLLDWSSHSAS